MLHRQILTGMIAAIAAMVLGNGMCLAEPVPVPVPLKKPAADSSLPVSVPTTNTRSTTINPQAAVARANESLNKAPFFSADFVQFNADGSQSLGRLYVERPGKMRFEFTKPETLLIVADGTSVSVRDRKMHTQDVYFIDQTPLKFLLKEHVNLARDTKVAEVSAEGNTTAITIDDDMTLGGISHIKLVFDNANFTLRQWKVVDPQGYETLVSLSNIDTSNQPDDDLFHINLDRQPGRN